MKILTLLLLLVGCSGECRPWRAHPSNPTPDVAISAESISQMRAIYASTAVWAKTCRGGVTCFDDSDGDSTLYAGIACLAGLSGQCNAVRSAQGDDGKLWRSPARVGVAGQNTSSRDMLLGGLAYIVATKDQDFAKRLIGYIHSHNDKLCDDATDNRCNVGLPVYSEVWGTIYKIYLYIGLTPDSTMVAGTFGESTILTFESLFSPVGYQTHLPLVEMLIRQKVGGWTNSLKNAADQVAAKESLNPFYEYVAHGATQRAADLTISECYGPQPDHRYYWTWQEDDNLQRWTSRNGWDCMTMINYLTGDAR